MANLNGQYLDSLTLYKGLINIGSTVGQNVTASLQSLTDGDGNNLPIQVSTSQIIIGGGSSTGRLVVRGDGTNPIARFENNAGTVIMTIPATTGIITTNSPFEITSAFATEAILRGSNAIGSVTLAISSVSIGGMSAQGIVRLSPNAPNTIVTAIGSYFTTTANVGLLAGNLSTGFTATSGETGGVRILNEFLPTSGTATNYALGILHTVNQTGGANGITRGLYIAPKLTSAVDFRAIEVMAGSTSAHKLIRLANGGGNKIFEANANLELAFFGATPITQPTVTGSRGNTEDALNNLLTALADLGLIVNATVA